MTVILLRNTALDSRHGCFDGCLLVSRTKGGEKEEDKKTLKCILLIEARGGTCFRTPCPNCRAEWSSAATAAPRKKGSFGCDVRLIRFRTVIFTRRVGIAAAYCRFPGVMVALFPIKIHLSIAIVDPVRWVGGKKAGARTPLWAGGGGARVQAKEKEEKRPLLLLALLFCLFVCCCCCFVFFWGGGLLEVETCSGRTRGLGGNGKGARAVRRGNGGGNLVGQPGSCAWAHQQTKLTQLASAPKKYENKKENK